LLAADTSKDVGVGVRTGWFARLGPQ